MPSSYPRKDGQAELAWVAWLNTKMVYLQRVTHLSTNLARRNFVDVPSQTSTSKFNTAFVLFSFHLSVSPELLHLGWVPEFELLGTGARLSAGHMPFEYLSVQLFFSYKPANLKKKFMFFMLLNQQDQMNRE